MAASKPSFWKRLVLGFFILVLAGIVILLLMAYVPPANLTVLQPSHPTYEEAVKQIRAIIAAEPEKIRRPEGLPILLEHGAQTEQAFVLLHGLSNAPAQFVQLGELLHKAGANVFIPRMPYHGLKDRMNTEWRQLTAQEMLDECNRAADLAKGLGKRVIVVGLSINGTTVAWMAQNRSDIHRAVLCSPFLAPKGVPLWSMKPLSRLLIRLPNVFIWWDPIRKEKMLGPEYCYPRFPTQVIGQVMRLGEDVLAESSVTAPLSTNILVVTTASDMAVNNNATDLLVRQWEALRPGAVTRYLFPKDEAVPHDFIDPYQPDQKTALVYPKLMELLLEKPAGN